MPGTYGGISVQPHGVLCTDQKRPNNKRSRKGNVFSRGAHLPVSAAGGFSFASFPPTATATAIETR